MSVISKLVSATFTRPDNTTAYTANDVVGPTTTANLKFGNTGLPMGEEFMVIGASLRFNKGTVPSGMGQFRLHLFNEAPTAIADNAAFNIIEADRSKYVGNILLPLPSNFGDTLHSANNNSRLTGKFAVSSFTLYGVLETLEAYTPTAESVAVVEIKVVAI